MRQGGIGKLKEQSLLARYTFEILEQLTLDFALRACADVVNGFNQQLDQAVGYRATPHISECREPSQPQGFRMSPQTMAVGEQKDRFVASMRGESMEQAGSFPQA
jgi:hypothetical protein